MTVCSCAMPVQPVSRIFAEPAVPITSTATGQSGDSMTVGVRVTVGVSTEPVGVGVIPVFVGVGTVSVGVGVTGSGVNVGVSELGVRVGVMMTVGVAPSRSALNPP